jgi:penicillin-binding protein 2
LIDAGGEHSLVDLRRYLFRCVVLILALTLGAIWLPGASRKTTRHRVVHKAQVPVAATVASTRTIAKTVRSTRRPVASGPWRVPTFADSTEGDQIDGEDLVARRAAVDALGRLNGTVIVADPDTGRILTIVNQRLAFRDGYQPCSTVKIPVALAALSESVVERDTRIRLYGRTSITLTDALAKSNNQYFATLGQKLGFERVSYYARLFGLGEKAGLDIEGEQAGILPSAPPKNGMGMMTSFGDGIALTPLELTALVSAVANGGTLYYLQYPKTQAEAESMLPRVKRRLDIDRLIPEIKPGLAGAVEYGTARRIGFDPELPIYGKTGTCTDERTPTHLGWFGSFMDTARGRLAVTVLLTGGRGVSGPAASGVAGAVYHNLLQADYFAHARKHAPVALLPAFGVVAPGTH